MESGRDGPGRPGTDGDGRRGPGRVPVGADRGRTGPKWAVFGPFRGENPPKLRRWRFFSPFDPSASLKTAFCISGPGRSGVFRQNFRRFRLPQGRSCVLRPPIEPSAAEGGVDAPTRRPASVSGTKTVANRPKTGRERDSRFFPSVNSHEKKFSPPDYSRGKILNPRNGS